VQALRLPNITRAVYPWLAAAIVSSADTILIYGTLYHADPLFYTFS